ncbi:MAG: fatty acid hydroxylase, partial [Alphaproteobacteria bacterium HGW-Alphaproteobacteria-15]
MNRPPHQSNRLVLFENRWLEQFTVISVGWFVAIWAVIVPLVVMAAWGTFSPLSAIGLMLAGWFIWSIFEYIAHRKLFHFDTDRPWLERVVFIIHGNHHVQPRDELRNLMPPIVSVPVSMSIWALLWAMAGDAGTWMFVGFIGGYVAYDLTH